MTPPPTGPHRATIAATSEATTDIAILGAGPTGLALACALTGGPFRITLIDAGEAGRAASDPRALALSEGSLQLLRRLGAWSAAQPSATPIAAIRVSQQGGHGETWLRSSDAGLPTLGHVVPYAALHGALLGALPVAATAAGPVAQQDRPTAAPSIQLRWNTTVVENMAVTGPPIGIGRRLLLADGHALTARLVVHAEGAGDVGTLAADYGQHAIVCTATPATPHGSTAQERFTADGPLALLPLGDAYAVVLVAPPGKCRQLLDLDDAAFAAELSARLDGTLDFVRLTPRSAFPLKLRLRTALCRGREVWIGNAAQSLHPVSGQGFNLALRDAWTLADALLTCRSASELRESALRAWANSRLPDRLASALFTDGLVRLFSNDLPPLKATRDLGLALLDRLPVAKSFLARRMIFGARGLVDTAP